jgi:cytochrome P450
LQSDKEDILSRFLVESEKDPSNMTDKYLRDIILNFMIAGKDTSATLCHGSSTCFARTLLYKKKWHKK